MAESISKATVLSKNTNDYRFLFNEFHRAKVYTKDIGHKKLWPRKQPRIESKFKIYPFPHNEYTDSQLPDPELTEAQIQSTRRREAYPDKSPFINESKPPGIMDKNYDRKGKVIFREGRPVLPLPSILEKPIGVNAYRDLLEYNAPDDIGMGPGISTAGSSYGRVTDSIAFQGSVCERQNDFDDFMIQVSPVIIYLQKKQSIMSAAPQTFHGK